jgi:hypothetical protein
MMPQIHQNFTLGPMQTLVDGYCHHRSLNHKSGTVPSFSLNIPDRENAASLSETSFFLDAANSLLKN